MHRRTLLLSAAAAAMSGCASAQTASASGAGPDAFAVALYAELARAPGNTFVSPHSVSSAFALLHPGARGATAAQIAETFGFESDAAAAAARTRARADAIAANTGGSVFTAANAAWVEQRLSLNPAYAHTISDTLGGTIEAVDFSGDQAQAIARINAWAAANTNDRILEIISEAQDGRVLVLTNAVYFNGKWTDQFNANATHDGVFHAEGGDTPAKLMRQLTRARYFEDDGFQAAEFDYDEGAFALAVFLPRENSSLDRFERTLDGARLRAWLGRLAGAAPSRLDVTLPKIELRTDYDLVPQLRALGVEDAFTRSADLSGLLTEPLPLMVSAVLHKTFLKIDEEGTEAAAVTAIDVMVTSAMPEPEPPPIEFKADRPFFIALHHKPTGALVFLGRIATTAG